jgi:ATP-dependent Lon protease
MDSKYKRKGRMVRKTGKKKTASDKETKKNTVSRKKSISHQDDNDDDSVDSYGNIKNLIDYDYDSEDSVEETPRKKSPRKPRKASLEARKKIKKYIEKSEEMSIEEEEDEEEDEDEDEEDEDDEDEEEDLREGVDTSMDQMPGIRINFGGFGMEAPMDRMKPKRYKLKKEPLEVQKFVELLTKKNEPATIDDQIDQFKTLDKQKQIEAIQALERQPKNTEQTLMFKILTMKLPIETQSMVLTKYNSLMNMEPTTSEYYKLRAWLEKLASIPIGTYKELPAKMEDGIETCNAFMQKAQKYLAESIYGQDEAKLQILQFIATKMANPNSRGLSLLLAGPAGVGKTSLIRNGIAKALDWPFEFISLGGDSDATTYTGHQPVYEGSHCGKIVNSLVNAKSMSMVLMFDELDKISQTAKGEEVQNLLIHLTDPVQNSDFEDKYLTNIPIDLSKVMFAFSGNDLNKIDKILMDRMTVINFQPYTTKDKIAIGMNYLLPIALKEVNLTEKVSFSKEIIEYILENHAKEESGVREFKRAIEQVAQKINMLRVFNAKDMPFFIENFSLPFTIQKKHVDLFLKKKDTKDQSYLALYT